MSQLLIKKPETNSSEELNVEQSLPDNEPKNIVNKLIKYLTKQERDSNIFLKIIYDFRFTFKNKKQLQTAVDEWCDNRQLALQKYGTIKLWDICLVTDLSNLFNNNTLLHCSVIIFIEKGCILFLVRFPSKDICNFIKLTN